MTALQRLASELAEQAQETDRGVERLEELGAAMNRPSEGLRRGLALCAREKQSRDIATALRRGMAYGLGDLRFTEPHGTGSGSVTFEVQLQGHPFRIVVEPIEHESAARVFSPAVPSPLGEDTAGSSGGGDGGETR